MKRFKKFGEFAERIFEIVGFIIMPPIAVVVGASIVCLAGFLVLDTFSNKTLDAVRASLLTSFAISFVVGCATILCGYLICRAWQFVEDKNAVRKNKGWIVGLSFAAVCLICSIGKDYIDYDKRFDKADRITTGHVVDVDPGEPPSGDSEDGDSGREPSSHYQFEVNGVTYDGWTGDELSEGDTIAVRYNSSDPSFNHASDDQRTFPDKEKGVFFLLIIVIAVLIWVIRDRRPSSDEPASE